MITTNTCEEIHKIYNIKGIHKKEGKDINKPNKLHSDGPKLPHLEKKLIP